MKHPKYKAHYTVDSILVLSMSGAMTVRAKDADHARERAIIKLAKTYADITRIVIHEVYKAKVPGYVPVED